MTDKKQEFITDKGEPYFGQLSLNELDSIDNAAYHFRFFILSEQGIVSFPGPLAENEYIDISRLEDNMNVKEKKHAKPVLIAESGSTTVGIGDVSIKYYPYHSSLTKTGTATDVDFTIVEPNAVTLFDMMRDAAISLGIESFIRCSYYLELTFLGRDVDSSNPVRLDRRWIYPLVIKNITTSITSSGSEYKVEAMSCDDEAHAGAGTITQNCKVECNNAVEAFRQLETFMNKEGAIPGDKTKANTSNKVKVRNRHYIHVDSTLEKKLVFDNDVLDRNVKKDSFYKGSTDGVKHYQWPPSTSFIDIINNLLSVTKLIERKKKDPNDKDSEVSEINLYKIVTRVVPINPNAVMPEHGDNINDVIKHESLKALVNLNPDTNDYSKAIVYYILPLESPNIKNPDAPPITKETSRDLLKKLTPNVLKKYDYTFTGLNDQVDDIDLTFNFAFQVPFPPSQREVNTQQREQAMKASIVPDGPEVPDENEFQNFIISQPVDVATETPIASSVSDADSSMGHQLEGGPNSSRSYFNAILSQSLKQGDVGGDLLELDLSIKGDLSWLGPSVPLVTKVLYRLALEKDFEDIVRTPFTFKSLTNNATTKGKNGDVNYDGLRPAIVFRTLPPGIYNDETGLYEPNKSQDIKTTLIGGLYYVNSVQHNFSGGVFKQTLRCHKETGVLGDQVENAVNTTLTELGIVNDK